MKKSKLVNLALLTMLSYSANAQTDTLGWDEFYAVSNECFEDPYQPPGSNFYAFGINSFPYIDVAREYKNSDNLLISSVLIDVFAASNLNPGATADITIYKMEIDEDGFNEPNAVAFESYLPSVSFPDISIGTFGPGGLLTINFPEPILVTGDFAVGINFGGSQISGPANFVPDVTNPFGVLSEGMGINHTLRSETPPMGGHTWIRHAPYNVGAGNDWLRLDDQEATGAPLLDAEVDMGIFPVVSDEVAGIQQENSNLALSIYPNPSANGNLITIQAYGLTNYDYSIKVHTVNGKEILIPINITQNTATMETSQLISGVYFVSLISTNAHIVEKLIIK